MRGLGVLALLVLFSGGAWGADSYRVNSGATVQINEHSVCQRVTNNHASGQGILVPTKTASEWTTFRNNRPAGVTLAACPPQCAGKSVGGYCWYAGVSDQSCTQVCSARGGVNMAGTRDYAGSGGTNANCLAVLNALSLGSGAIQNSGTANLGCSFVGLFGRQRYPTTTTAEASNALAQRACACNN